MRPSFKRLASPRLVFCALGASAAAAIAANAVLLQPRPHPAPWFATRESAELPEAVPPPALPTRLVREAQERLSALQLYEGEIDGVAGTATRAAIVEFQRVVGLAETGEATPALLIELARAAEPAHVSALPQRLDEVDDDAGEPRVAAVQRALARAAYGPLEADGVAGSRTREAVSRFQMDHGLPVTGEIDAALVEKLAGIGALEEEDGEGEGEG